MPPTAPRLLVALLACAGCGDDTAGFPPGADSAQAGSIPDLATIADLATLADRALRTDDAGAVDPLIAKRPYMAHVPPGYSSDKPAPLLVMLHGYASSAAGHEAYFKFAPLSDAKG